MGRRPSNNPRQIASKACHCPTCTAKFRPGEKPTSRDCIGSWQYRYTGPDGRPRALNRDAYDQAVADGEKARVEIRQGSWIDPRRSSLTLDQWWTKWEPNLRGGASHRRNLDGYWRNHIQPRFGGYPLHGIGYLEVQTWVNELGRKAYVDPETIRKIVGLLKTLLNAAVRDGRITASPCSGLQLPEAKKRSPEDKRPPTYAQLWLIRAKLPRHYHALQILAQETGLRWGELTDLRACWVDLPNRRIHVREVIARDGSKLYRKQYPKSEAGYRSVPLSGLACRVLADHMAERQPAATRSAVDDGMHPEELVFIGAKRTRHGRPHLVPLQERVFNVTWNLACERAGVQRVKVKKLPGGRVRRDCWPTWHSQRHSFASRLHDRQVPEAVAQEVLGHERGGAVTWLYTHAAADYAGQVLAAMDDWKQRRGGRRLRAVS